MLRWDRSSRKVLITGSPVLARSRALNDSIVRRKTDRIMASGQRSTPEFARERARAEAVARIGVVVRSRMEQEGITSVRGFADHVGMSWKPIDKLLNGDPNPPLTTLLQLTHALRLRSIEELLGPFETTRVLNAGRSTPTDK